MCDKLIMSLRHVRNRVKKVKSNAYAVCMFAVCMCGHLKIFLQTCVCVQCEGCGVTCSSHAM